MSPKKEEVTNNESRPIKTIVFDEVLSWAKMIVFTVIAAVLINQFVIVNASIPTGSMESVIMPNDRIIAFRLSYLFREPERFDIVIFRFPNDESRLYVKRIIGLPGETVTIYNGRVYIDGADVHLRDDFVSNRVVDNHDSVVVPDYSYFMLGDNRRFSEDSRAWGFVHRDNILGRAIFKYYRGFGLLH
ncbi:MAG: signal peptidase I [Defluviitaleaceae bacterium]|nr:signal peptidase I [Defluviitaleaceae bacterium]